MSGVNKVIILGHTGNDPDIKSMNDGKEIANLSIATSETWKDKNTGEKKEKTEWHRVVIFNENLVKIVKNYVKKGSKIYVEGQLQTRKWTDKDGSDRYVTEVVLPAYGGTIQLLDSKNGASDDRPSAHNEAKQNAYQPTEPPELDDEIPF